MKAFKLKNNFQNKSFIFFLLFFLSFNKAYAKIFYALKLRAKHCSISMRAEDLASSYKNHDSVFFEKDNGFLLNGMFDQNHIARTSDMVLDLAYLSPTCSSDEMPDIVKQIVSFYKDTKESPPVSSYQAFKSELFFYTDKGWITKKLPNPILYTVNCGHSSLSETDFSSVLYFAIQKNKVYRVIDLIFGSKLVSYIERNISSNSTYTSLNKSQRGFILYLLASLTYLTDTRHKPLPLNLETDWEKYFDSVSLQSEQTTELVKDFFTKQKKKGKYSYKGIGGYNSLPLGQTSYQISHLLDYIYTGQSPKGLTKKKFLKNLNFGSKGIIGRTGISFNLEPTQYSSLENQLFKSWNSILLLNIIDKKNDETYAKLRPKLNRSFISEPKVFIKGKNLNEKVEMLREVLSDSIAAKPTPSTHDGGGAGGGDSRAK